MASVGLLALSFLWRACALRPQDDHVNLSEAIGFREQHSHGKAVESGQAGLPQATATKQVAFRSDSALVQLRSDALNKSRNDGIKDTYKSLLFDIVDTDNGGTISKKEWNKKVGRKSMTAKQPVWRDTLWKEMLPPAPAPAPAGGKLARTKAWAKKSWSKLTTSHEISLQDFTGKFQDGVNAAFAQMGGGPPPGGDSEIHADEVDDDKIWKGATQAERSFAKDMFITPDGKMDDHEFTEFLFTAMLFRTMDIRDKGEALWKDIEKDKEKKAFLEVFGGAPKMETFKEKYSSDQKAEKGFDVGQFYNFLKTDTDGAVFA